MASPTTLIHVPVSHYSEKARWAFDHKRVPHTRRWPPFGLHPPVCLLLTRGRHQTVPVLVLDGEGVGDSTEIIRRLEERFPDPPLYPSEPAERRRALELEEHFDEELGPYIRRMGYHHLLSDPRALTEIAAHQAQYIRPATRRAVERFVKLLLESRFGADSAEAAETAEAKVVAALDRLEAELGGRDHLVGDTFTVADLTAASLLYPLVLPPQGPWRPSYRPEAWTRFQDEHRGRPAMEWIAATYDRHRSPAGASREARSAGRST